MTNTMDYDFLNMWEEMVDELGICTNEELGLVTAMNGRTIETLESVLYIRTGHRSLEEFVDEAYNTLTDCFDEVDEEGYNPYLGSYDFDC